jgi:hypothetical protein
MKVWGTYEHTLDAGLMGSSQTLEPPAFLDGNLGISKTEAKRRKLRPPHGPSSGLRVKGSVIVGKMTSRLRPSDQS